MIQLLIRNESDLYDPYDPSQMRIDEGVYRYLKSYCTASEAPKHIHDTLRIISDSPIDADRFQSVLQDAVNRDIAEFDRQIAVNKRRVIWSGLVGVFFCVMGIILTVWADELLLTIISLLGTLGINNAITTSTTVNHDIKTQKKLLDPIGDIRLEVVPRKEGDQTRRS